MSTLRKFKKVVVAAGLSLTTTVWLTSAIFMAPIATAYSDGDFKDASSSNIYVLNNGMKVWVRSAAVFDGCGYDWAKVKTISNLTSIPTADLIKSAANPDVYRLEKNFKRKLASTEIFSSYSLDWNKLSTVCQNILDSYSIAPLIQQTDSPDIYWVQTDGLKHKMTSWQSFVEHGFNMNDVIAINSMEMGSYSEGTNITATTTTPVTCTDSDTGKDYLTKGTTSWGPINGITYTATDNCNTAGTTLSERYCSNGYSTVEYHTCPNGCVDGACLPQSAVVGDLIVKDFVWRNLQGATGIYAYFDITIQNIGSTSIAIPSGTQTGIYKNNLNATNQIGGLSQGDPKTLQPNESYVYSNISTLQDANLSVANTIIVQTDDSNIVAESIEGNNFLSKAVPSTDISKLPPCESYGDLDGHGYVSKSDSDLTRDIDVGNVLATDYQKKYGDVSGDGTVGAYDSALIQQYVAGTITTFPICTLKTLSVLAPNGGQVWQTGQTHTLSWQTTGLNATSKLRIFICSTNSDTPVCMYSVINNGVLFPLTTNSVDWTIPTDLFTKAGMGASGSKYKIQVSEILTDGSTGLWDRSDTDLTISTPKKTSPCLNYGDLDSNGYVEEADASLVLQIDTGIIQATDYQKKYGDVSGDGTVEAYDSGLIKQYVAGMITTFPACSMPVQKSIITTTPNGGESWYLGNAYSLTWQASNLASTSKLRVFICNTNSDTPTCMYSVINSGTLFANTATSFSWIVPTDLFTKAGMGASGSKYKIQVSEILADGSTGLWDRSDADFTISTATTVPVTCTDSDTGKDYLTKGTTSWGPINGVTYTATDNCNTAGTTLSERYCSSGYSAVEYYTCPNGCSEGTCNATAKKTSPCESYGDLDSNGYVETADAELVLQVSTDNIVATDWQKKYGDVSGNGTISAYDSALIQQYVAGMITTFPVCSMPVKKSLSVISPNGGEVWETGKTYSIAWQSIGLTTTSQLRVFVCNTNSDTPVCMSSVINAGALFPLTANSFSWTVPTDLFTKAGMDTSGSKYKIQVSEILADGSTGLWDRSDADLMIST